MDIFTLMILGGILSAICGALFWGLMVWLGVKVARNAAAGKLPAVGLPVDAQFVQAMQAIQELIRQAQTAQATQATQGMAGGLPGAHPPVALPPELQVQFQTKMLQLQQHMRDMDQLHRQQHDVSVSGMLGQASAAGIDVSGWRL